MGSDGVGGDGVSWEVMVCGDGVWWMVMVCGGR